MYAEIFTIIAPLFICALLGYVWARSGQPFDSQFVSLLVMNIGAPCLIVGTLGKINMPPEHFTQIMLASSLVLLLTGAAAVVLCLWLGIPLRAFVAPLSFPNTGNMGLPLSLFAFGEQGLAVALGFLLVMMACQFSVGIALVSGARSLGSVLRSPVIYAAVVAIFLVYTEQQLPSWLQNTVSLLGGFSIPLMLITLGVTLAQLKVSEFILSTGLATARLVIGLAVGLLVVHWLELEGVMRGVVVIQSAMPVAVFNYLLALRYGRAPEAVAGMVVMSTLLGFLLLPAILWLVL